MDRFELQANQKTDLENRLEAEQVGTHTVERVQTWRTDQRLNRWVQILR